MDWFVEYCDNKKIKAFDKHSIDSIVAVAMAAKIGNITLLEQLVQKIGIEILNAYDRNHFTPLHIVCQETRVLNGIDNVKQLCIGAKRLIELGANPNIHSLGGYTPLSISALKEENMPLTDLLIQNQGKITSCVSHLIDFIPFGDTKGLAMVEPIIRWNIFAVQYTKAMTISNLLCVAKDDKGSAVSIIPAEIIRIISLLFWHSCAYKE